MSTKDMYTWREPEYGRMDLSGFEVEASDGTIGKVHEDTKRVGANCIVVDTGPWILGKKVMLPAATIKSVDHDEGKIFVDRPKDEIKDAPEFDEDRFREQSYRDELGSYYSSPERQRERQPTRR